ncbi:alpha-(1,3)-fucosyltransferase 7-like [Battus philenor]|uniref:alpha-(1,3)-fucosyltransferase 7-like n=1 Tax=Battus philenor TaxID=42288 RepID=UPI0035D08B51
MNIFSTFLMRKRFAINKVVGFIVVLLFFLIIYELNYSRNTTGLYKINSKEISLNKDYFEGVGLHKEIVNYFYNKRQAWKTSNVGSILFKDVSNKVFIQQSNVNRTFTILIWKYGTWLQNRHLYSFGSSREDVSLKGCSVKNCIFTNTEEYLESADAVVVHLQHGELPNTTKRKSYQRWIFLSDESPKNTFSLSKQKVDLRDLANVFNWSMTYRSESDVPVPYGRTVPKTKFLQETAAKPIIDLVPFWNKKRQDVLATVLMSNCAVSQRMAYLKELKKHLTVDILGQCSDNDKNRCPGHFRSDCPIVSEYLFYLALENSKCREYLTEKVFYNAYYKGAIPIISGPKQEDCEKILPPNSFLHVDNYATTEELAMEIISLSKDIPRLLKFHEWRRHFEVINEHGYFGSQSRQYCRICEALNYNDDKFKTYDEETLRKFLDSSLLCT